MIEPKYVIFMLMFITAVPAAIVTVNRFPKLSWFALFAAIFFTSSMLDINFVSREWYRGTSRGFEIGMVDIATLVLMSLAITNRHRYQFTSLPRGSLIFFAYFLCSAISLVNCEEKLFGFFELFKMLRVYVFFWTMNNIIISRKAVNRIIYFTSFVAIYVFLFVMRDKYYFGMYQNSGPFPHQNSLVMYLMPLTTIHFSCWLSSKNTKELIYWCIVVSCELFCIVCTLSRAGMALTALSVLIVLLFHLSWKISFKKLAVIFMFGVVAIAGSLKSLDSIITRFLTAPEESANTRVVLAQAAVKMADDKTLGIGLNNFSLKMNTKYPYSSHIHIKVDEDGVEEAGGIVETVFLLIASESGWHTLGIYFFFLISFYMRNLINLFCTKDPFYKSICIGIFAGLTGIYIESSLEWVLRQTNNFYQLMLMFALINALIRIRQNGGDLVNPQVVAEK